MGVRIQEIANADTPTIPAGRSLIFLSSDTGKLTLKKDDQNFYDLEDTDVLAAVSSNDTTPDYLENKIVSGNGISVAVQNEGANENLQITADVLSFNARTGAITQDIFQATQQVAQTGVTTAVPLLMQATNQTVGGTYTYSAVTGELTFVRAGKFRFTITVSADTGNGARQTSALRFQRFNGVSFVDIPTAEGPSLSFGYHRNNASGEDTHKITCVLDVTVGQRFRPTIECASAGNIDTIPAGTSWLVEEI